MICELSQEINLLQEKTIFHPNLEAVLEDDWNEIIYVFQKDYNRYYKGKIEVLKIKYYPGLLATLFYRISRRMFLSGLEKDALEFSSVGFSLTSIELYYSAEIGESFKINHGMGTVVGSRTKIGNNCMLHQGVTIGDKNGGRASLGDDVVVYPGAVIVGNIHIGGNSIIGANVFVDKSCDNNSKIF